MTALDIKPCPFCGGEAEIWRAHRGLTAWIACMGRCAVLVSKEYTADEEAIAAWNTRAPLAAALAVLTDDQVASACLSYRHDFGLLDAKERALLMFQAREWLHAWRKELPALRAIGERAAICREDKA